MDKIKFGLKLWSTTGRELIRQAEELISDGIFSYVELMPVPGDNTLIFEKVKIPYILHIPHNAFGFNIGEKNSWDLSFEIIKQSINLADRISAKYMILHPGYGKMQVTQEFLENINDRRILIENMPFAGDNNEKMIGYNQEQIGNLKKNKFGFCLDFGHAVKASMDLGEEPKEFIKKFLALEPKIFHLSDGTFSKGPDEHLNIGDGEYDFKFFLDCIKENDFKFVTLETPKDKNSLANDIKNLIKIKQYIL